MHGHITKFREDLGVGVIVTDEGRKYRFSGQELVNRNGRVVGHDVDFVLDSKLAKEIILMTGTPWQVFGATDAS